MPGDVLAAANPDVSVGENVLDEAISALARPGWPVRRMCKPTDIIRGRSAPSS